MMIFRKKRSAPTLPPLDVIDVRVYALGGGTAYAYIGTESGEGSHELVFRADSALMNRARPYIENGELYGLMLDKSLVLAA